MPVDLTFAEEEIQKLFGHEAAEDEDPARLREYYFKTSVFEQVAADLPLRVLVGHKGIGKSALFQVAMHEDRQRNRVAILIKPDDISGLATDTSDFLKTIRYWKVGLLEIVARKVLTSLGGDAGDVQAQLTKAGGRLIEFLRGTFADVHNLNLAPANIAIVRRFLESSVVSVYIDDLDRGWEGRREDVVRISALLNAVRDLVAENPGLRFRVSLRSDVYYLVRTSDESTDKIEGSVLWQSWTNHEILVLLIKRIETFFGRPVDEGAIAARRQRDVAYYLDSVMEPRFLGSGHWEKAPMYKVIMSLIRRRPRDLVKLCTLAARHARKKARTRIATEDFTNVFAEYSQGRVQDTINEYRSELPDIQRLLLNMKPSKKERTGKEGYVYATDALLKKIDNVMQTGVFRFKNGQPVSRKELAAFMYKINFLTARKEVSDGIVRSYFEDNRYLSNEWVDFGFAWEIHPAYRWALQPDDIRTLFATLELSHDGD
jgi:hypothetical protein